MKKTLNLPKYFFVALSTLSIYYSTETHAARGSHVNQSNDRSSSRVNIEQDFDTLGGNEVLIKKAQALDPDNKIRIVQKRLVDRNMRFEINGTFGGMGGGDSYVNSTLGGGGLEFHINPRWSLGVRHQIFGNKINAEGSRLMGNSQGVYEQSYDILNIDYPINTTLGTISWYPIYGKANIFDAGISQFDLYLFVGGGQMNVGSGTTSTWTSGLGVGFWLTQHLTARTEIRYQNYKDRLETLDPRSINAVIGQIGIGLLL